VLQTSTSFEQHHSLLGASLRRTAGAPGANPRFVQDFIRPRGLRTPATLVFCDAVDDLAKLPAPPPECIPPHLLLLRWAVYPVFRVLQRIYGTELFRDDWRRTDPEHQRALQLREEARTARHKAAQETKRERERRRAAKTAARAEALSKKASGRKERGQARREGRESTTA
jgi:hypothetical protein